MRGLYLAYLITSPAASNAANHSSENGAASGGGFTMADSCFPSFLQISLQQITSKIKILNVNEEASKTGTKYSKVKVQKKAHISTKIVILTLGLM